MQGVRIRINHTPRAISIPDDPERIVESGWGRVPHERWCALEARRQLAKGVSAYVRRNGGRRIYVAAGDPMQSTGEVLYVPTLGGRA
jgi:hypothetical protein